MEYMKYILIAVAYLLGSIPTALILGKITKGINIREHGSGNLGTTNAFRVLGFWPGLTCLIVDILKGSAVILIIRFMDIQTDNIHIMVYGLAAIIGHVYPVFANFKGGKAVATSLGVSLAVTPIPVSFGIAAFVITLLIWGYVSLSSTISALTIFGCAVFMTDDIYIKIFYGIIVAFIIIRHTKNYKRLMNGTEAKVGFKQKK